MRGPFTTAFCLALLNVLYSEWLNNLMPNFYPVRGQTKSEVHSTQKKKTTKIQSNKKERKWKGI